jgi:hypothetical protein
MLRQPTSRAAAIFAASLLAFVGCGPDESPVQASQRPLGFDILAPVQAAGSDQTASQFRSGTLPTMIQLGAERFNKENIAARFSELALDPERLKVEESTPIRVYFVGENAGLQNSLGVSLDPPGQSRANPRLIFPNTSTNTNLVESSNRIRAAGGKIDDAAHGPPTTDEPVVPGDFVDLGRIEAGTTLNFFLVSDGARKGTKIFWPDPGANADKVQHMVAIALPDSPYLILSFEDLPGGGDRDYSDCVFAVSLSHYNVQALLGKIDPWRRVKQLTKVAILVLVFLGGPIATLRHWRKRRKRRIQEQLQRANALIDADNPAEALNIIRKEKKRARDKATIAWLGELELNACNDLVDVESIAALYDETPESFETNESAALWAAKAALENDRQETLTNVAALWKRPDASGAWACLKADTLSRQDRQHQAQELLESESLTDIHEGGRLARLATIKTETAPTEASDHMQQALNTAPEDPDVHLHAGQMLMHSGKRAEAAKHVEYAVSLAPHDPFVRDRAGDFFQRRGDHIRALQVWGEGLGPPSTGFLWLKTLFWCKIAHPVPIDFANKARPDGPLRPLIDLLLNLSPHRFWDELAFAPIVERVPELANRQEVYWLRLLETIREKKDVQALSLLKLSTFGRHAWHPLLERSLLQIMTFQEYNFLDSRPIAGSEIPKDGIHSFFYAIDQWAQGGTPSAAFHRLLQSEDAPAAACLAAGWFEAGLRLQKGAHFRNQYPAWYDSELEAAHQRNGSKALAAQFAQRRSVDPATDA